MVHGAEPGGDGRSVDIQPRDASESPNADSLECGTAAEDGAHDPILPGWAVGSFYLDPPTAAFDAFNLRLGPQSNFEWAVTGCDLLDGDTGVIQVGPAAITLLPGAGMSTFEWMSDLGRLPVTSVTVRPGPDGGLVSEAATGVLAWSPGTHCGCGTFGPCGCQDPFWPIDGARP
jgi:hypothetical protein